MKMISLLTVLFTGTLMPAFRPPSTGPAERLFCFSYENVLGTSFDLKVKSAHDASAQKAESAALSEISRLSHILSGYDSSSEFCQWARSFQRNIPVSPELYEVLDLFQQWKERSHGAVDASAETLSRLWKKSETRQQLPSQAEMKQAMKLVHQMHYRLDPVHRTACRLSKAPLRLNSFAKSYIIQKAADQVMQVPGVSAVLLNIGGDLVIRGRLTESMEVRDPAANADNDPPLETLQLENSAVASSGNYKRGFQINGNWYSHIIDPRSGLPAHSILGATVIARSATDAGALATALNVLNPEEGLNLVASVPGASCLIATTDGRILHSPHWPGKTDAPETILPGKAAGNQPVWDDKYELLVTFSLTRFPQMTRRPFVAVWVENADHEPVRSLALWYNKPRWLPELKTWYRAYYNRLRESDPDIGRISSATRPSGKYILRWDGKDDRGQWVKPGTYFICLEAAREHGTYQLIRQEINCAGKPVQLSCEGNTEIESASIDYKLKSNGN